MEQGAQEAQRGLDLDIAAGLVRLSRVIHTIQTRVAERHDLTGVQARLLCLVMDGPRGMAELAQILGVEKAALTGLMDRVERRDLARRSAVPGDRRALQVTLTDVGYRTARAFHAEATAEITHLADPLSTEGRDHFHAALVEILAQGRQ
jgi:DNA-binding MarR family transcriptional regulator